MTDIHEPLFLLKGGLHILSGSGYPEIATEVAGLLGWLCM